MPEKNVTVKVPQRDGDIVVRNRANEPATYAVKDGTVSVKESEVARILAVIDGASVADTGGK